MTPSINNPGGVKNAPEEIRDGVVSDATRFPGGFIDQKLTQSGAAVEVVGQQQVNTATFIQPVDVSSQETSLTGLTINSNGTALFVIGSDTSTVYQYSLPTAFDVSTRELIRSFDVTAQDSKPQAIDVRDGGSKLYTVGSQNDNIYQYDLSTAFDISTASFAQSFDIGTQSTAPVGLDFRPDGTQAYINGPNADKVYQYDLSTAFDISTASFSQSFDVSGQVSNSRGLSFNSDGDELYAIGATDQVIAQYHLSTAFDISTATFTQDLDTSPEHASESDIHFKPDGGQLYTTDFDDAIINQYGVGKLTGELS